MWPAPVHGAAISRERELCFLGKTQLLARASARVRDLEPPASLFAFYSRGSSAAENRLRYRDPRDAASTVCRVDVQLRGGHPLSLPALATMIAEFLTGLDLRRVTVVCNDWGGAQLLISPGGSDRVAKLVLVSCSDWRNR